MSEKFKAYRGLAGGVLKAVAGFYLVFFTSLFTGVREVLEAARRELVAANLSSITGVESVVMGALEEAKSVLQGDALDIAFGVGLWALGTLLFAREWSRLASYWPGWARKAYAVVGWGLRLAAVAAGVLTAGIVSKALGGELPEVVEAFRSTWLFTHLYAAPLLA
ncbi:MAG: hypothetical protein F7B17_01535, partial [Desulfurococcales archaeon]|nr:hypothetical protein [Desulfurococcales archaeon]